MIRTIKEEISELIPRGPKKNASRLKIFGFITVGVLILIAVWQSKTNPFGKFRSAAVSVPEITSEIKLRPRAAPTVMAEPDITDLQASLAALLARVEILESGQSETGSQPELDVPAASPTPAAKTFSPQSLYLGSASTASREWAQTGLEVQINSADYPADVKAVFEAGLSIIGGEASARLKNKTSGAIISATEVMHNNNTVTWKTSGSFKLHSGNNVYAVELKSSSGETANLSGSRLRLTQ